MSSDAEGSVQNEASSGMTKADASVEDTLETETEHVGPHSGGMPADWSTATPRMDQVLPPMMVEDDQSMVIAQFLDDEVGPPTDEMPSPVLEDLANIYTPPMDLPEAPPLQGLADRFTPVSVERIVDERPPYAATPVNDLPEQRPVLPPPVLPYQGDGDPEEEDEDEGKIEVDRGIGWLAMVAGAVFALVALVVMAIIAVPLLHSVAAPEDMGGSITLQATPPAEPVEERGSPYASGADPLVAPAETEPPAMSAARTDERFRAPVSPPVATKQGAVGTLKIRSNRRVLIKIDGKPKDYSPLDLPVTAGTYRVSAALPGRPDTEQHRDVELGSGSVLPISFTF